TLLGTTDGTGGYQITAEGVQGFTTDPTACTAGAPPPMTDAKSETVDSQSSGDAAVESGCAPVAIPGRTVTWAELGVAPEVAALVSGRLHVYTSTDGGAFAPVTLPAGGSAQSATAMPDGDGYRIVTANSADETMHTLISSDGVSWADAGAPVDGWVQTSGQLGGRPALVVANKDSISLLLATSDGGWSSTDLNGVAGVSGSPGSLTAAIGPLGVVATITEGDVSTPTTTVIASTDGVTFETHHLADLAGDGDWYPMGVAVSADAMTIRMLPSGFYTATNTDRLPADAGPQHLVVGTRG
ncbi:MAG: hypothetical protein ABIV94_04630, partial [Acidimicrobiales bacterium]